VAEGTRLLSEYGVYRSIAGSNPALSACSESAPCEDRPMHWVKREDVRIGRIACTRLIHNHIEPEADIASVRRPRFRLGSTKERSPFHVPLHPGNGAAVLDAMRPVIDAFYAYCSARSDSPG
jgi:hypothetical protein